MTTKALAIVAGATLLGTAAAAQTSQKLTAGKANEYGLVYSLPKTAVDIYIETRIAEAHPGEFHNYARRHLGITDAVTADSRNAEIIDVVIVPRGIPNPDQRWLAQFKAGSTPYMLITDDGLPLAINSDEIMETVNPAIPAATRPETNALIEAASSQAVTADMARSSSTSKRAELAAQRIFELRETRNDILSGQADNPPADGQAMKLVLDNLSAQETALTAMFSGTRSERIDVGHVQVEPDSTGLAETVVARLSVTDGIVAADNLAGSPVTVEISITERGNMPVMENGAPKTFPKGGVAYNIPGRAVVRVRYGGKTVAEKEIALTQAGSVFGLDPKLFIDKKEPSKVLFDPVTGGIVEIGPAN